MHQVNLLSTFLCNPYIAGKSRQQLFKLWDGKLYTKVNGFDNYVVYYYLRFLDYKNINENIFHNKVYY